MTMTCSADDMAVAVALHMAVIDIGLGDSCHNGQLTLRVRGYKRLAVELRVGPDEGRSGYE